MNFNKHCARLTVAFSVCLGGIALAQTQGDPVVLTITAPAPTGKAPAADSAGKEKAPAPSVVTFNMKLLKSLPQRTFVTKTPWYKDPVKFTGPLLRDVLAAAKVKGESMSAIALDDYQTKIPFSDAADYDVILAHQMDGKTLTPKDKGPLFVVYPYDSKPELQSVRFYERSIWQLKALRVE
jgi:hypothetical protein